MGFGNTAPEVWAEILVRVSRTETGWMVHATRKRAEKDKRRLVRQFTSIRKEFESER
jgi:hypothetical protein